MLNLNKLLDRLEELADKTVETVEALLDHITEEKTEEAVKNSSEDSKQ